MANAKETKKPTKAIPPVRYEMDQDTYDSIKNLLDTILRGTGIEGLESVNGVLDGIKRIEESEKEG